MLLHALSTSAVENFVDNRARICTRSSNSFDAQGHGYAALSSARKRSACVDHQYGEIFLAKRLTSEASGNSLLSPTWPIVRFSIMVLYRRLSLEFAPMRADIFSRGKELTTMHEMGVSARFLFGWRRTWTSNNR